MGLCGTMYLHGLITNNSNFRLSILLLNIRLYTYTLHLVQPYVVLFVKSVLALQIQLAN